MILEARSPLDMINANRIFFHTKYEHIGLNDHQYKSLNVNDNNVRYSHFWSLNALGVVFGRMEFYKYINCKDYLESPVEIDTFLEGVYEGAAELEQERAKAKEEANNKIAAQANKTLKEVKK